MLPLVLFRIINSAISIQFDYFNSHIISYDFPQLIFKVKFHHYLLFISLMISVCLNHFLEFSLRLLSSRLSWLSDQSDSPSGIMRAS
jgi:hypothetical protein